MDRRTFLKLAAALPAASALSGLPGVAALARAQQREFDPRPGDWRSWQVTTRVEIGNPAGVTRAWVPVPVTEGEYQKVQESRWSGNARVAEQVADPRNGAAMVYAEFAESEKAPVLEVVSRFQTRDRRVDWSKKTAARLAADEAKMDSAHRADAHRRHRQGNRGRHRPGQELRPREGAGRV